jgi:drug/metabolite transporter (DMT)-like permease
MLGAFLALLSAVAFSFNAVLIRRGILRATPTQATFITVMLGVPMFLFAAIATGQLFRAGDLPLSGFGYLTAGGIVNFIAGRHFNYKAIEAIGAARSAPFQALTLPYSVLIAFVFLGEGVGLAIALGVLLIMIGPVIMVERRRPAQPVPVAFASPEPVPVLTPKVELRQVEGYVAAILAAIAYGTSPILFRAALEDQVGLSVLAGLVAYLAAAVVLLAGAFLPGRRDLLNTFQPVTVRLFFGASFSVFIAQMLRFLALSLAPVAVVTSLERMNSVFTLILSWYMNRSLEFITLRVVLGVIVSLLGTLLLVAAL